MGRGFGIKGFVVWFHVLFFFGKPGKIAGSLFAAGYEPAERQES